jgi:hypothetical protein
MRSWSNGFSKLAKKQADALSTTTGKTFLPTITAQTEAQEEANRLNVINQSVIGAKEGVVEAVSKLVGTKSVRRQRLTVCRHSADKK